MILRSLLIVAIPQMQTEDGEYIQNSTFICTYTCGWVTLIYGMATISRLLKIEVFFAKEPYKTGDILQKRRILLRSLLIVATSYPFIIICTMNADR